MSSQTVSDYDKLNKSREVMVSRKDLPLFCPTEETSLWCAHPKVFLAIENEEKGSVPCPYCGTVYTLVD